MSELQEKILEMIKEKSALEDNLSMDGTLLENGLDSLDAVELSMDIEDEYNIVLDETFIQADLTINDLVTKLNDEISD